jgi:hypothetical protein
MKPLSVYALLPWMVLNVALLLLLIPGDYQEPNTYIELMLRIPSIAGLLSMKKWGAPLTIATSCVTLGTSMGIAIYYPSFEAYALVNSLRIVVNVVGVVRLSRLVFAGKFS